LSDLSIVVADEDVQRRHLFHAALQSVRHIQFVETIDSQLVEDEHRMEPCDVLILGASEPDETLTSAFERLSSSIDAPIVIFVDSAPVNSAASFIRQGAAAFIVDGLSARRVAPIVEAALERHRMMVALHSELVKSKTELSARKVIEKAKGLLMQQQMLSEAEAYDSIRRSAMARGKTVLDVSQTIITLSELMPKR
jgi:response regulator NasT